MKGLPLQSGIGDLPRSFSLVESQHHNYQILCDNQKLCILRYTCTNDWKNKLKRLVHCQAITGPSIQWTYGLNYIKQGQCSCCSVDHHFINILHKLRKLEYFFSLIPRTVNFLMVVCSSHRVIGYCSGLKWIDGVINSSLCNQGNSSRLKVCLVFYF